MTAGSHRLLIDVSQFVSWPTATGVQRVLRHLAENWGGDEVEAWYGFIDKKRYVTGPLEAFSSVIASSFTTAPRNGRRIAAEVDYITTELHAAAERILTPDDVEATFDAYLLPEPTLRADSLSVLTRLRNSRRTRPFIVYYDALPLTHPQFHPRNADVHAAVTRYHRTVSEFDNVAFISEAARQVFEMRIARRRPKNAVVIRLGADALRGHANAPTNPPTFTVVGTIEPRKRHRLVLSVFEQLWAGGHRFELLVLGARGSERPELFDKLEFLSQSRPMRWIDQVDDRDISDALSRSSALVFLSDAEGYGLPPLEALALGCPVIVSASLPALEGLPELGQVRLMSVEAETLRRAVELLADPEQNRAYRSRIRDLDLPSWSGFSRAIENWVASGCESRLVTRLP